MKKIFTLIFVAVAVFAFTACDSVALLGDLLSSDDNISARTYDLSPGIDEDRENFSHSFDMDGDGTNEDITMEIKYADEYDNGSLYIAVGNYSTYSEIFYGTLEKVYACDMDTEDGLWDLAVITMEESGDPRIRIYKYNEPLTLYNFMNYSLYDDYTSIDDCKWIGYVDTYYFNVNNDDTLTIEEQTPSAGMWCVYKTYRRGAQGIYEEVRPEKYEILPDTMEIVDGWPQFETEKEKEMWQKGYIMAHCPYSDNEISLKTGDFFKALYDDGNNKIYIEKENGESGWLDVSFENSTFSNIRHELNPAFFMLAG